MMLRGIIRRGSHAASGYSVFRWTNFQKDTVRSSDGKCLIWGSSPKVIRATYAPLLP